MTPAASGDRVLGDGGAALVARRRRQVRPYVAAGDEEQARVRVRRRDEAAAVADHEELEDRQEALKVRLLVDGEVEVAVGNRAQSPRQEVVAAGADYTLSLHDALPIWKSVV